MGLGGPAFCIPVPAINLLAIVLTARIWAGNGPGQGRGCSAFFSLWAC